MLGVVPVIIARRIHFSTLRVLRPCGVIVHETYNQRMANADADLAEHVRHKDRLGYHDVRVGNLPDSRLTHFIADNLPTLAQEAPERLSEYEDLLLAYSSSQMAYSEFSARVRRREAGTDEDSDRPMGEDDTPDYFE
jgi:hypothetical protein